jgi:putative ABC transport system ATP-binding protein
VKQGLICRKVTFVRSASAGSTRVVLDNVEARFAPASRTLISGPTGAGKSTLLHLLGGLERPHQGEIRFDGQPISRWIAPHRDRWRQRIGLVFQQLCLVDGLSALENVYLAALPHACGLKHLRRMGLAALERLQMSPLAGQRVEALSGGQRQRVAIARALVHQPQVLLMDEPTAFQDDHGVAEVISLIEAARQRGALVVVCSHDPRLVNDSHWSAHYHLQQAHLTRVADSAACSGIQS